MTKAQRVAVAALAALDAALDAVFDAAFAHGVEPTLAKLAWRLLSGTLIAALLA
jgi:hypothetical protein